AISWRMAGATTYRIDARGTARRMTAASRDETCAICGVSSIRRNRASRSSRSRGDQPLFFEQRIDPARLHEVEQLGRHRAAGERLAARDVPDRRGLEV